MSDVHNPSASQPVSGVNLEVFDYHKRLRDHFKERKKTWDWFRQDDNKRLQIKDFKTELLKNTYRLDPSSHANLFAIAAEVCQALSIDAEVILYQENNSVQLNAVVVIVDKEAHIVLSGNLMGLLTDDEMKALLAHELSHYLFFKIDNEEYEVTQRIVYALANDSRSEDAIIETARIFQLYMELYCDLGALKVCQDHEVVIRMLVKLNTGIAEVNAQSYLEQAREIIKMDTSSTQNETHPESYIRSLALFFRSEKNKEYQDKIHQLIEGALDLNKLDLFEQEKMRQLTENFLQFIVKPKWMNSAAVMNLCAMYFDKFYKKDDHKDIKAFGKEISKASSSVKNFFGYVLLDFSKVDPNMENAPLGFTFEIAELLDMTGDYEKIVRKELKLTVKEFKNLKQSAMAELQQVKEGEEDTLYSH